MLSDAARGGLSVGHFILEEDVFIRYVDLAFRVAEQDGSRIVLLGVEPHAPEPEYGYIVPGEEIKEPGFASARKVELFVENPGLEAAEKSFGGEPCGTRWWWSSRLRQ